MADEDKKKSEEDIYKDMPPLEEGSDSDEDTAKYPKENLT